VADGDDSGPVEAQDVPGAVVGAPAASPYAYDLTWPPSEWASAPAATPPVPPPPPGSAFDQAAAASSPAPAPASASPPPAPADDGSGGPNAGPGAPSAGLPIQNALSGAGAAPVQLTPPPPGSPPAAAQLGAAAPQAPAVGPDGQPIEQPPSLAEMHASAQQQAQEDSAKEEYYRQHPEKLVEDTVAANHAAQQEWYAQQSKLAADQQTQAAQQMAATKAAYDKATAATAQVVQDGQALAATKIDPQPLGLGATIAGVLFSGIGGAMSQFTGGRNLALEQFEKNIDRNVAAQKDNIANKWKGLQFKQTAIGDELARHGDLDRATTAYRVGAYQSAMNQLDAQAQNYDPRGTTVRSIASAKQDLAARQQAVTEGYRAQRAKENLEQAKADADKAREDERARHDAAMEENAVLKKGRGAGAGGEGAGGGSSAGATPSNPVYTTATGLFDPFTGQPVMGKRGLGKAGGKGVDEKEPENVTKQLDAYSGLQNAFKELATIAARANGHKNLAGAMWSHFADTDTREYEAAREKTAVLLVKSIGDTPRAGQIEAQAKQIPELNDVITTHDVGKMIGDAQDRADRDFKGAMNIVGADGDSIINNAKAMRKPAPTPDALMADEAALTAGNGADADRARADAAQRLKDQAAKAIQDKTNVQVAVGLPPAPKPLDASDARSNPRDIAFVQLHNRLGNTYGQLLDQFHAVAGDESWKKGITGKGDLAAAQGAHDQKVADAAGKVVEAHEEYSKMRNLMATRSPTLFLNAPAWPPDATVDKPPRAPGWSGMGDIPKDAPPLPKDYRSDVVENHTWRERAQRDADAEKKKEQEEDAKRGLPPED
jgi:hypothetical protein